MHAPYFTAVLRAARWAAPHEIVILSIPFVILSVAKDQVAAGLAGVIDSSRPTSAVMRAPT
jgi:hypothetical protein